MTNSNFTLRPVVPLVAVVAIVWALLIDLPTQVPLGPTSVSGAATVGLAALMLFLLPAAVISRQNPPSQRRGCEPYLSARFAVPHVPWPLIVFLAWAAVSLFLTPSVEGIQNVAVYLVFVGAIVFTAASSSPGTAAKVRHLLAAVTWLAIAAQLLGLLVPGLAIYNSRSFALTALVLLAVAIPDRSQRWFVRLMPYVLLATVALSLSRTALAVAGLMMPFIVLRGRSRFRPVRAFLLYAAAVAGLWVLVNNYAPLRERFLTGDAAYRLGGVGLNTSGRSAIWSGLLESIYAGDPLLGQGSGSAAVLVTERFMTITQPHNEYLRLWHDFGLLGVGLFVLGYLILIVRTLRSARRTSSEQDSAVHWSAFLALTAVGLAAITDNVFVYPFVMVPLGVVVGLAVSRPPSTPVVLAEQRRRTVSLGSGAPMVDRHEDSVAYRTVGHG